MAKVLVAGGGGYLGIPLCEELSSRGHTVIAFDRFFFRKYPSKCESWKLDIRTIDRDSYLKWCDTIVDLCGLSNDASAEIDPTLTMDINLDGAIRLIDLAKEAGVRRYIYASSASVYGHGEKQYLNEEDEVNPLTLYAKCKVDVESHLLNLQDDHFETVILRNATVFGVAPRMRFDLAVNIMTLRAWRDKIIYVMGGGSQWRPYVHVSDVVRTIIWALEADKDDVSGETFNVGTDEMNMTVSQLARLVKNIIPDAEIHHIPDDLDKRSYHLSFGKLASKFGPMKYTVEKGIREVLRALQLGDINGDDPTAYTVQYYKQLIEWDRRIEELRLDGRLL